MWYLRLALTTNSHHMPVTLGHACCLIQATHLGVPVVEQDRFHYLALVKAGVQPTWDGRAVEAPAGVIDKQGMVDLTPYMPAPLVRENGAVMSEKKGA